MSNTITPSSAGRNGKMCQDFSRQADSAGKRVLLRFFAKYVLAGIKFLPVSRPLAPVVLLIVALAHCTFAWSDPPSKVVTITGQIVAYAGGLGCLNGSSYWSMLIHVENRTQPTRREFLQVDFSLPCNELPKWLNRKPPVQRFRLRREKDADAVLKEFLECAPGSSLPCPELPVWRRVPSGENEKLPFGQVIPNYRSLDLRLEPFVI